MIIKDLNLIGFGQFNNETIELKEGLNIIYGKNESGKTTIHNFINGMFYGFLKPYARKTSYLEEHIKYDPWDNSKYSGIIRFIYGGKEYRIERNFRKNQEKTNVFIDDTGEDITNTIDNGGSGRVLQPGNHFFGFNDAIFSNTISIKQAGSKTDESLQGEVRDRLINISTSLDDSLSIERAINELNNSIKEIGSPRASTSPYAKKLDRLNELKNTEKEILNLKVDYDNLIKNKEDLDNRLSFEKDNLKILDLSLKDAEILKKYKIYLEIRDIKVSIKELKDKKTRELESNRFKIQETSIDDDYMEYEKLEEERLDLRYNDELNKKQFMEMDLKESIRTKKRLDILFVFNLLLMILSLGISIYFSKYILMLTSISIFPIMGNISSKIKHVKSLISRIHDELDQVEKGEKERINRISFIDKRLKEILAKYDLTSKTELKNLWDQFKYSLFTNSNIDSELNMKEELLNRLAKDIDYDSLEEEIKNYHKSIDSIQEPLNIEKLKNLIVDKKEKINYIKIDTSRKEERINYLNKEISKLVEVEEEIFRLESYLQEADTDKEALELAKVTIENISKDIHHEFAPMINKKVGAIIGDITDGKYTSVKIDNSLEIGVLNPETKEIIDINSLSGGTIDQLYFALRFGVVDSMGHDNLPLILDDCFVQYDDIRLKNILKFLYEKSKERQIILFTCQDRENRTLDELGIEYNLIKLDYKK